MNAVMKHAKSVLRGPVQSLAFQVMKRTPVEGCGALWADLLEVKVPRSVHPNLERSPEGSANINIIFELLRETTPVPGDIAECGVFRGASLLAIGLWVKQHRLRKRVLGFDSFAGFDHSVAIDVNLGGVPSRDKKVGGFGETSYEAIADKVKRLGLGDTIQLSPGFFTHSLKAHADRTFSFVHLDCDLYQSYLDCLSFFYPRMSTDGVILFDEYNDPPWPGCNLAIDQFLADKPERPVEIERDNFQKWYIRKR